MGLSDYIIVKAAVGIAPILLISGCATLSAAMLPESRGNTNHLVQLTALDCVSSFESPEALVVSPAILDVIYNKSSNAFKGYVERKAKRFTSQYSAVTTVDDFSAGTCLRLQRIDRSNGTQLMSLLLEIRRRGNNSMEIVPAELTVNRFAASTSSDDGSLKARVTVSVGLSFVNSPPIGPNPVTEINLPIGSSIYEIGESSLNILSGQSSKLFPNLSGRPVNVAVTVSESGSGSEVFEDAIKGYDENANALKAILGQIASD